MLLHSLTLVCRFFQQFWNSVPKRNQTWFR